MNPQGLNAVTTTAPVRGRRDAGPIPRELSVLLLCARIDLSRAQVRELSDLLSEDVNWVNLVELAERHGLVPLAQHHLGNLPESVPAAVRQNLAERNRTNAVRVLRLTYQLRSILDAFSSHDIVAVPFKGPVLGQQLYGNIAFRQGGDLDILIRPEDYRPAYEILLAMGFTPSEPKPRAEAGQVVRKRRSVVLTHGRETTVELKWRFTNADIGWKIGLSDLIPRVASINVSGSSMPVFSTEDLAILLAVNGARHRWSRLEWLCGYAELCRSGRGLDLAKVVDTAGRLGIRRMVLLALFLAHELLNAPVPAATISAAGAEPRIRTLAADVQRLWAAQAGADTTDILPLNAFLFQLRERRSDQLRFLLNRSKYPTDPPPKGQHATSVADVLVDALSPALTIPRRSEPKEMRSEPVAAGPHFKRDQERHSGKP